MVARAHSISEDVNVDVLQQNERGSAPAEVTPRKAGLRRSGAKCDLSCFNSHARASPEQSEAHRHDSVVKYARSETVSLQCFRALALADPETHLNTKKNDALCSPFLQALLHLWEHHRELGLGQRGPAREQRRSERGESQRDSRAESCRKAVSSKAHWRAKRLSAPLGFCSVMTTGTFNKAAALTWRSDRSASDAEGEGDSSPSSQPWRLRLESHE